MKLCLMTMCRDSASSHQLARFHRQVRELEVQLRAPLTLLVAEGDSRDHTRQAILDEARDRKDSHHRRTVVVEASHGGPTYGSTEEPERLAALSTIFNRVLDAVPPKEVDVVLWVESDLRWAADTLLNLAAIVQMDTTVGAVAPGTFAGVPFYDTWGARLLDGRRVSPFHPYLPPDYSQQYSYGPLIEMGSIGSCLAMQTLLARRVRVQQGGAIVEWCQRAREDGWHLYLHGGARVDHDHADMDPAHRR